MSELAPAPMARRQALNHLVVTRVVLVLVLLLSFCHSLWQGLAPLLWREDTKGSRHIYKPLVKDLNYSEWVRLLDC